VYETTQVQVTEEDDAMRRMRFCNWFLQAVYDSVLAPELTFFTDEAWFHLRGCISIQNNRYWSTINLRQTFEAPFHNLMFGVRCAILLHEK
jgi:hypothetical protein